MSVRLGAALAVLSLVAGCEVAGVEGLEASQAAVARTCAGSTAASLKVDRESLQVVAVRSLPEGEEVTLRVAENDSIRCYTNLEGRVIAIKRVTLPPAET